jgi:hypothetical protein
MKYFVGLLAVFLATNSLAVDFNQVLGNPRAYHHQRVTLTGVARVQGLSFDLYGNSADANNYRAINKALSISPPIDGPKYDRYDNRWVRIVGIVDANQHGRIGYPCVILLENLQPLPTSAAGKPHVVIEGVFRNDDSTAVNVVLFDTARKMYAEFGVPPGEINGTGIRKGTAEVQDRSGRIITRYNRFLSNQDSEYFDSENHIYYYHLTQGKLEGVRPNQAKKWASRTNRLD